MIISLLELLEKEKSIINEIKSLKNTIAYFRDQLVVAEDKESCNNIIRGQKNKVMLQYQMLRKTRQDIKEYISYIEKL